MTVGGQYDLSTLNSPAPPLQVTEHGKHPGACLYSVPRGVSCYTL